MRNWLYPGARVVCANANPLLNMGPGWAPMAPAGRLREGAVYTVTEVFDDALRGGLHVRLAEVTNWGRTNGIWGNIGYNADRFRPLHDCSKTIESLKRAMRDHIKSASGGLGIKRRERA